MPKDIDAIVCSRGFLMGPITMFDMNGIDVACMLKKEHGYPLTEIEQFLFDKKRFGRKTGSFIIYRL